MSDINLLPQGITSNASVTALLQKLKIANFVLTILLIVSALVVIGVMVVNSTTQRNLENSVKEMQSKIKQASQDEQQYYFAKDRITTINEILSDSQISSSFSRFESTFDDTSNYASINVFSLNKKSQEMTISFNDGVALKNFIDYVKGVDDYKVIKFNSISYSGLSGYQVNIVISDK